MKVCLIDTPAIHSKRLLSHWTPLGLAYIAATLESSGHEVSIIERDVLYRRNYLNLAKVDRMMVERLRRLGPDMVGISSPTELFPDVVRTANLVKKTFRNVPVAYGGHHATAVPQEVMAVCSDIDIVAVGEGEETMRDLADGVDYGEIQGICYRNDNAIIKNPARGVAEKLDALPMPARHLLDMDFHTRPSFCSIRYLTLRSTTMLTSRGCPFRCSFCVESLPFGKMHRFHSTPRILAEMDEILSGYEVEAIYFLDEGFSTDESRVRDLCEGMIEAGFSRRIKWVAQARVDSLSRDLLSLMKEAGCIQLECGFETASDRLLKEVRKGTSHRHNLEIIELIKSAGIRCLANIIASLPGETEEDFHDTVGFIEKSGVDAVIFSRFSPHPGSMIYDELLKQGRVRERFWETDARCYEKLNFTAMPDETFRTLYERTRKKIIDPMNSRDRMLNTSIRDRLLNTSFRELLFVLLNSPVLIPRFLFNWFKTRLSQSTL